MQPTIAEQSGRTEPVRLPVSLVQRLRVIAQARQKTMGEVIEELAGDEIAQAHAAVIEAAAMTHDLGSPVA